MIENELVVYSKPSCVQCSMTYRALDEVSRIAVFATADSDIRTQSVKSADEHIASVERNGADPATRPCAWLRCFLR